MPKFKKIGKSRRPSIIRADVSYYSKGVRRALKITYPADAEQRITTPAQWKVIYQDDICKVVWANATRDTTFTIQNEAVFFLVFRDGRKVRIYRDELTDRRSRKLNASIRRVLFPENLKKRVRWRTYK